MSSILLDSTQGELELLIFKEGTYRLYEEVNLKNIVQAGIRDSKQSIKAKGSKSKVE